MSRQFNQQISDPTVSLYSTDMLKQHIPNKFLYLILVMISSLTSMTTFAAEKRYVVENETIKMVIIPRAAQQMSAFYEGREFPANAIKATQTACFFTVGIHNKSDNITLHNTKQWQVFNPNTPLSLLTKDDWKQRWDKINLPQRFQSTFRWTLLPKQLDFHAGEHEGGNITIPRQDESFTLIAHFINNGKKIALTFTNLRCAMDNAS